MNQNEEKLTDLQEEHISFERASRNIRSMNLINGFLFDSVLENEENAKVVVGKILGRVLGKELSDIKVSSQKVFNGVNTKFHGIRMDAHISKSTDDKKLLATVYDLEVENRESDRLSLPKRQRYYSAISDSKTLAASDDYRLLPEYISVTILSYDPFLLGDMYYEARSCLISHLDSGFEYDDGIMNIFLYADGRINTNSDYGNSLKHMLKYIVTGEKPDIEDIDINAIDTIVTKVKLNAEVTREYMKQWDREATLIREAKEAAEKAAKEAAEKAVKEAAEKAAKEATERATIITKKEDSLEIIRFAREDGVPDEKIRVRLRDRLNLASDVIEELFNQVDNPDQN